jgi:hypothetical protein
MHLSQMKPLQAIFGLAQPKMKTLPNHKGDSREIHIQELLGKDGSGMELHKIHYQ